MKEHFKEISEHYRIVYGQNNLVIACMMFYDVVLATLKLSIIPLRKVGYLTIKYYKTELCNNSTSRAMQKAQTNKRHDIIESETDLRGSKHP